MRINPAVAPLGSGQSQKFVLEDDAGNALLAKWSIDPPSLGLIGESDGVYIAPSQVRESADVTVTAIGPGGATSKARVILTPISLTPAKVDLHYKETQQFMAHPPDAVTWQISPEIGKIDPQTGIYTAPEKIIDERMITVFASSGDKIGIARVNLKTGPPSTRSNFALGAYLALVFAAVGFLLVVLWPQAPCGDPGAAETRCKQAEQALQTAAAELAAATDANGEEKRKKLAAAQEEREQAKKNKEEADNVNTWLRPLRRDIDLLLIAILAGALGTLIHITRSYVDFLGNRTVRSNWRAWYILYPFIGGALALVFYLMVRAGFFAPGSNSSDVNAYGIASISALVGMFTKQATDKLGELFSTLFKTDKDKDRKDKLDANQPRPT